MSAQKKLRPAVVTLADVISALQAETAARQHAGSVLLAFAKSSALPLTGEEKEAIREACPGKSANTYISAINAVRKDEKPGMDKKAKTLMAYYSPKAKAKADGTKAKGDAPKAGTAAHLWDLYLKMPQEERKVFRAMVMADAKAKA